MLYAQIDSPLGPLLALGDSRALRGLYMQHGRRPVTIDPRWQWAPPAFDTVKRQLDEYFAGVRIEFDLPVSPEGNDFQRKVWRGLQTIPYGKTTSYGELAERIGAPGTARAVGAANGANPICIVIPCHRVIGADGKLTGYAGGLERKRYLLDLEDAGPLRASPAA